MYGFFPGGDPRRFTPDGEDSNTPEELAAHKIACAEWNAWEAKGKPLDDKPATEGACRHLPGVILTLSMYGFGLYTMDCDDLDCDEEFDEEPDPFDTSGDESEPLS